MYVGVKCPREADEVAHDEGYHIGVAGVIAFRGWVGHHVWAEDGRCLGDMGDAQAPAGVTVDVHVVAVGIEGRIGGGGGGGVGEGIEDMVGGAYECCFAVGTSSGRIPGAVAGDGRLHGICVGEIFGLRGGEIRILIRDEGDEGFWG